MERRRIVAESRWQSNLITYSESIDELALGWCGMSTGKFLGSDNVRYFSVKILISLHIRTPLDLINASADIPFSRQSGWPAYVN